MSITVVHVDSDQASRVINVPESQFADAKAKEIAPAKLTKTISAFANSDGGELFVGITENGPNKERGWHGFPDQEAANAHLAVFERLFPLGTYFSYEFLESDFGICSPPMRRVTAALAE